MNWHADSALLSRYAAGRIDEAAAASVEAHLLECERCRAGVAQKADGLRLESIWEGVDQELAAPGRTPVESALVRLGVASDTALLVAATPSLTLSWLTSMALALSFALLSAQSGSRGLLLFLALAPLLPLAGVAVSYGPGVDPTYELTVSSPMSGFRLFLLRSAAVLSATTLITSLAAPGLPQIGWMAAAWLLPALGLTLATLAVSTITTPLRAAVAVGSVWVLVTVYGMRLFRSGPPSFAAFGPRAQLVFAAIGLLAAVVIVQRRSNLETGGQRR